MKNKIFSIFLLLGLVATMPQEGISKKTMPKKVKAKKIKKAKKAKKATKSTFKKLAMKGKIRRRNQQRITLDKITEQNGKKKDDDKKINQPEQNPVKTEQVINLQPSPSAPSGQNTMPDAPLPQDNKPTQPTTPPKLTTSETASSVSTESYQSTSPKETDKDKPATWTDTAVTTGAYTLAAGLGAGVLTGINAATATAAVKGADAVMNGAEVVKAAVKGVDAVPGYVSRGLIAAKESLPGLAGYVQPVITLGGQLSSTTGLGLAAGATGLYLGKKAYDYYKKPADEQKPDAKAKQNG